MLDSLREHIEYKSFVEWDILHVRYMNIASSMDDHSVRVMAVTIHWDMYTIKSIK